ncbi:ferritin-like domain-containing protein [Actinocrispum wychmicini]|uniref:Ferritin-like protein n=1 Tax=Actinocrispum wychmicini TaxID=1213861 RepID=A0A4R2JRH2_9PSEU|nr:ferritin-like protein [Actinocrispum wychmicini]TCO62114.1 ferritin-like protein [Actinocrispum wychmicini]
MTTSTFDTSLIQSIERQLACPPEEQDLDWLKRSLQTAVELELSTIPPYLCGLWSIENSSDQSSAEAAETIWEIVRDEMFHAALACNLLTAIGGTPDVTRVPGYPCELPGIDRDRLRVYLGGLTREYVQDVFMAIELPEQLWPADRQARTIGEFYDAVESVIRTRPDILPPVTKARQYERNGFPDLPLVDTYQTALKVITRIKEEGEGSRTPPDETPEVLPHYYRFGALVNGRRYVRKPDGKWDYVGAKVPFPTKVYPMMPVPDGGWQNTSGEVADNLKKFDVQYKKTLTELNAVWRESDTAKQNTHFSASVRAMREMGKHAKALMRTPLPGLMLGNYGPDFRPFPIRTEGSHR